MASTASASMSILAMSNTVRAADDVPSSVRLEPRPTDVICARGKAALEHPGNRRFRSLLESYTDKYKVAHTKLEKSLLVTEIIDQVRKANPPGGFLRQEGGVWYEAGDGVAREKIGQGFRDLLHTKYKSSTKAKKRRRTKGQQTDPGNQEGDEEKREAQMQRNSLFSRTDSPFEEHTLEPFETTPAQKKQKRSSSLRDSITKSIRNSIRSSIRGSLVDFAHLSEEELFEPVEPVTFKATVSPAKAAKPNFPVAPKLAYSSIFSVDQLPAMSRPDHVLLRQTSQ